MKGLLKLLSSICNTGLQPSGIIAWLAVADLASPFTLSSKWTHAVYWCRTCSDYSISKQISHIWSTTIIILPIFLRLESNMFYCVKKSGFGQLCIQSDLWVAHMCIVLNLHYWGLCNVEQYMPPPPPCN